MRLAERRGVEPRNVEVAVQRDHVAAHERHVEIAGARSVGVERLVGMPFVSRDGAAAEDHLHTGRRRLVQHAHELVVSPWVAAESEAGDALADGVLVPGIGLATGGGALGVDALWPR